VDLAPLPKSLQLHNSDLKSDSFTGDVNAFNSTKALKSL
jgi:hypothetical protein